MQRQIINTLEFHQAIDDRLADMPPILKRYREVLRRCLRRNLQDHDSIRPARLRKSDPDWAKAAADPKGIAGLSSALSPWARKKMTGFAAA